MQLTTPDDVPKVEVYIQNSLPDDFIAHQGIEPLTLTIEQVNYLAQQAFDFYRPLFTGTPFGNEMEGAIMFVMGELERVTPTRFHPLLKYRINKSPWFHKPHLTWRVIQDINSKLIVSFSS